MRYISTSLAQLPELANWYKENVGYDPTEDSPEITRDELAELILEYARERLAADGVDSVPAVELKNVSINQHLSEETPCYSATAYVDGVKLCTVSNRGHGGCDDAHPIQPRGGWKSGEQAGEAARKMNKALALIEWRFRLFSEPRESHGHTFHDDFETGCMAALETWENVQQVKRALRGKIAFKCPQMDGLRIIKASKAQAEQARAYIADKYPGAVILNDVTDTAELVAWYFDDLDDPRELVA
jgi:hypothetical protein